MSDFALVLTTVASTRADAIASALVEAKLAACVSIFPMRSVYRWQGEVQREAEWQLVIKTRLDCFAQVEEIVRSLDSYELPEMITIPIQKGSTEYLNWIGMQLR